MLIARHVTMLGEGVPEWVHLLPAGEFSGVDGRGPYRVIDPKAVIAASPTQRGLPIDENHATHTAAQNGGEAPARAWIRELEAREDGIWGRVEWTDAGAALMTDKAYKWLSPEFVYAKDGTVLGLLSAGLTNRPNLRGLHALHTQKENRMDLVQQLRSALGLPETADDAAILAAVNASRQATATHTQQLGQIAVAIGLTGEASTDGILTALQAQKQNATDVARMAQTITGLEAQLQTLRADQARAAAVAFVDGAIKAGKPINALRDHYIARHVADPASVEKEIGALVALNTAGTTVVVVPGGEPDGDEPTETERMVATRMGLDPKKLAQQRKQAGSTMDGRAA